MSEGKTQSQPNKPEKKPASRAVSFLRDSNPFHATATAAFLATAVAGAVYSNIETAEKKIDKLRQEITLQKDKTGKIREELTKEESRLEALKLQLQRELEKFLKDKQTSELRSNQKS